MLLSYFGLNFDYCAKALDKYSNNSASLNNTLANFSSILLSREDFRARRDEHIC